MIFHILLMFFNEDFIFAFTAYIAYQNMESKYEKIRWSKLYQFIYALSLLASKIILNYEIIIFF